MSWILIALGSAAASGVVSIFDKTVIHRYLDSPLSLPLLIGLIQTTMGLLLVVAMPWPEATTLRAVAWGLGSGALWGISAALLLRVLYSREVSRTIPVYSTFPIFAALMAVLFLGEDLTLYLWAAIVVTVSGAILLSVGFEGRYGGLVLHRSFFALMLASAVAGAAMVAAKVPLETLPLLNTHGLRNLALGGVLLATSLRPAAIAELKRLVRQRSPALGFVALNEMVLGQFSMFMTVWALSLGPASLVTTLIGTRSFFLVLYSTGLAMVFRGFLGEETAPRVVAVKLGSSALIVAGVAAIGIS